MSDSVQQEKPHIWKPTLRLLAANAMEHNVGKSAAALAFYLLFALFPLLISQQPFGLAGSGCGLHYIVAAAIPAAGCG